MILDYSAYLAPPMPRAAYASHVGGTTAIVRTWHSATDAMRCTFCPRAECSYDAREGLCVVHVRGFVALEDAATFTVRDDATPSLS